MPREKALTAAPSRPATGPVFTVERANRALVYVRPIVADIVARYRELMELRSQTNTVPAPQRPAQLQQRVDHCVATLSHLHRELLDVGCVLKDWRTGLLDFPAVYDGRRVWLCWRLGEASVTHWHELHDGFAGRKKVIADFV